MFIYKIKNIGCLLSLQDGNDLSPLHHACEFNHLSILQWMIDFDSQMKKQQQQTSSSFY